MTKTEIKKAAEKTIRDMVEQSARDCQPEANRYGMGRYEHLIKLRAEIYTCIHAITLLMINMGLAKPGEYNHYRDQAEQIIEKHLAEINTPEQPA